MAEGGKVAERGSEVQTPTGSRVFINSAVRLIYGGGGGFARTFCCKQAALTDRHGDDPAKRRQRSPLY